MLSFTDTARGKIDELVKAKDSSSQGIRIKLKEENRLEFSLLDLTQLAPEEEPLRDRATGFFVEHNGFMMIVDRQGQKELGEATVNFEDGGILSGIFKYEKPEAPPPLDTSNPLVPKVQDLLDREINPGLATHGGRAELLNVLENKVYLKFGGGCQGCGMIDITVKQGIEARLREVFPQIKGIVDETDHAAGTNPYYKPQ